MTVPVRVLEMVRVSLEDAYDQATAVERLTRVEAPDRLSQKIEAALAVLRDTATEGGDAPDNVERHQFTLKQMTEQFVYELMRERGWERGAIIVGSAQVEAAARRMLHGASVRSRLSEQLRVLPLTSGRKVEAPDGWALVQL